MQLQNELRKSSASDDQTHIHAVAMNPYRQFAAIDGDAHALLCLKFISVFGSGLARPCKMRVDAGGNLHLGRYGNVALARAIPFIRLLALDRETFKARNALSRRHGPNPAAS